MNLYHENIFFVNKTITIAFRAVKYYILRQQSNNISQLYIKMIEIRIFEIIYF